VDKEGVYFCICLSFNVNALKDEPQDQNIKFHSNHGFKRREVEIGFFTFDSAHETSFVSVKIDKFLIYTKEEGLILKVNLQSFDSG
jgi:hypothetical protein